MIFPEDFLNKIINADSLETLKLIPSESIDLVVTSPPYNLAQRRIKEKTAQNWKGKSNKSKLQIDSYDTHSDYMKEPVYILWQQNILKECFRVIKDDGAIFYNHKWRVQNGLYQQRLEIIKDLPLRQIIIWKKAGGINFNEGYFLPTFEIIYFIAKPKFKLPKGINAFGDVWSITQEKGSWHPAPFPVELAEKCVQATNGSIILDPFSGSGTTAIAAKKHNKNYIGIEISKDYVLKSEQRILDFK